MLEVTGDCRGVANVVLVGAEQNLFFPVFELTSGAV